MNVQGTYSNKIHNGKFTYCNGWYFCKNKVSKQKNHKIYCCICRNPFCKQCTEDLTITTCEECGQLLCENCLQPPPSRKCNNCCESD